MNYGYDLTGGAPVIKRYRISETLADPGVYVTVTTAGLTGVVKGVATTVVDQLGVTVSTATYSTTQGSVSSGVDLILNPLAVYRLLMSGGATEGTALTLTTASAAASNGLSVTKTGASGAGDPDPNSPTMDEGTIVCVSGANLGQVRKITSVSATVATVIDPFAAIAVGDQFILVPWTPGDTAADNIQTTTLITQARQDIAVGTGADLRPIELEFDVSTVSNAQRNSYVYARLVSHVHANGT
jgi:hypothetical protein